MSGGMKLGLAFAAVFLIGGPIASTMGSHSPTIGIVTGIVVYVLLSAVGGQRD